jgi:hypothetical protein
MSRRNQIFDQGKLELELLGQTWWTKKFLGFDWCLQRNKSLFGVLHRGGGPIE